MKHLFLEGQLGYRLFSGLQGNQSLLLALIPHLLRRGQLLAQPLGMIQALHV
ncbi:hypothetical protein D3C76_1486120 [compost metagenome]